MKKVLILFIILLSFLVIFQLAYYNFKKENKFNNTMNFIENSENISNSTNAIKDFSYQERVEKNENVIVPKGIVELSTKYKGDVDVISVEKELYKFITYNVEKIYNMANGKSDNKILQTYDLQTSTINSMNIYSKEDFLAIVAEVFKVANSTKVEYQNCTISNIKDNNEGYTVMDVLIEYSNKEQIQIKLFLANSKETMPNIKFVKKD